MHDQLGLLCWTAATIGVLHTLLGPDHYVPFIAMSRARNWSFRKTMWITLSCGIGHVLGSVLLGVIGIALGITVLRLESIEAARGDWAGWLLLAFGLVYLIWGLRRAACHKSHSHWHAHEDGTVHKHEHIHMREHIHVHTREPAPNTHQEVATSVTPWILFVVFLFGPCEPLIPLLMFPAAKGSPWHVAIVTLVFALATLGTMATMVAVSCAGLRQVPARNSHAMTWLGRYSHALAGLAVFLCGAAVAAGL